MRPPQRMSTCKPSVRFPEKIPAWTSMTRRPARRPAPGRFNHVPHVLGDLTSVRPAYISPVPFRPRSLFCEAGPVALLGDRREAHLSAQQARPQAPARLPLAHGDQGRPQGSRQSPRQGSQAPVGLVAGPAPRLDDAGAEHAGRTMRIAVERLRRRADFLRVAGSRWKYATPGLVLQMRPREDMPSSVARVGFTVTRKVGSAVTRNRARRRLREAARALMPELAVPGCDYVLIARAGTAGRPYTDLLGDLKSAVTALAAKSRLSPSQPPQLHSQRLPPENPAR